MKEIKNIKRVKKILEENKIDIKDEWLFYKFWNRVNIKDNIEECWNWQTFLSIDGYGYFRYYDRTMGSHRLAYILSKGEIPENKIVMHLCNNPMCCNPKHLKLGNNRENLEYALKCGKISRTKLNEIDIKNIHELYKNGKKQWEIAELYKIDQGNLSRILNGERWNYIYREININ